MAGGSPNIACQSAATSSVGFKTVLQGVAGRELMEVWNDAAVAGYRDLKHDFRSQAPLNTHWRFKSAPTQPLLAKAELGVRGGDLGGLGQMTGENRARAGFAFQIDPASVQLHQRLD
jgi:hypothetical protein